MRPRRQRLLRRIQRGENGSLAGGERRRAAFAYFVKENVDAFVEDSAVRLIGVEAGGEAIVRGRHAARFAGGSAGVLQGTRTFILQDDDGNIELTHSVSAGLDYAAIGPEHAWLRARGRAEYAHASDADAVAAFQTLARLEGILPALESAHAIAHAQRLGRELGPSAVMLVNLSGRGDKDVHTMEKHVAAQ